MLLALLLAAATQDAPPATAPDTIEVIGQRLRAVTVAVTRDPTGRTSCSLSASTGNDWLDARLCETATTCVKKGAETREAIDACITARKPDLLAEVRAARAEGRP